MLYSGIVELGVRVWLFFILELLNWGLGFGELGFD